MIITYSKLNIKYLDEINTDLVIPLTSETSMQEGVLNLPTK